MQRLRIAILLALVCILVLSISAYAQLPSTNWPKAGRDYHNSSHSPATSIAKPVMKTGFPSLILPDGASDFTTWKLTTPYGLCVDPSGNIIAYNYLYVGLVSIPPTGGDILNWSASLPMTNALAWFNGPLIDTNQQVIVGPQQGTPKKLFAANLATGANLGWASPDMQAYYYPFSGTAPSTSYLSPAVGPDGTVYSGNLTFSWWCSPFGPVVAHNSNGTLKWALQYPSPGRTHGAYAIKQVDGKNIIYNSGGVWGQYDGIAETTNGTTIMAIRDDGTAGTVIWEKKVPSSNAGDTGFFTSTPVLSDDGSTVYAAGYEKYPAYANQARIAAIDSLYAYNADTGVKKWSISTGGRHVFQPALGPGDQSGPMLYVCAGQLRTGTEYPADASLTQTLPSKLIAVKDNDSSAQVKWALDLPDDLISDTTPVVTIATNPTTMYVATGNARVYCVQDQGTYGKILWTWQAPDLKWAYRVVRGNEPSNIAVADDGTAYITFKNYVYAFAPGFNPSSPEGISGTVTDTNGNPIAGAWVAISASPKPLPDNASRLWTKTNPDGSYQISPKDAGTYYVAAGAVGYEGSVDQTAALTTTSTKITANFTLGAAKLNDAIGSLATSASVNPSYPAANAVDGNLATRYASTAMTDLTVDLGESKSIGEAVIYWELNCGKAYTIDYSVNGTDWTNAYTTTTGNGGFPLDWYATDPQDVTNVPANTDPGGPKVAADVIKFDSSKLGRYWKLNFTSAATPPIGTFQWASANGTFGWNRNASFASVWEFELRDATKPGPAPTTIGAARAADDGTGTAISGAVVTAMPGAGLAANNVCIETADRSAGIKVDVSGVSGLNLATIGFGDKVFVAGKVQSSNGEKYIAATAFSRLSSGAPVVALGINNRDMDTVKGQGLFVKTWGKVTDNTVAGEFTITDGSTNAVKVLCGSLTKPSIDAVVKVRGVAGKDASGTVLYMRNEQCDITAGDAEYQLLPLPGPYKYPREYAVCGPFSDAGSTDATYRLDHDFIADAGIGKTEATIRPNLGDACGTNTWVKADASSDTLDFLSYGGTNNCTFYAHLWIYSPIDQWICIRVGNDDSAKVFVNGAQVGSGAIASFCGNLFDAGGSTIELTPGFNSVLYKVENGVVGFSLNSQFVPWDATGSPGYGGASPVLGLSYTLDNPTL